MKESFLLIILLVFTWCSNSSAIQEEIQVFPHPKPEVWDPENNENQYEIDILVPFDKIDGNKLTTFHVNVDGGIYSIEIRSDAPLYVPFDLNQNLFPEESIVVTNALLYGATIPKCTYFSVSTNFAYVFIPGIPEPFSFSLLCTGLAGLITFRRHHHLPG